MEVRNNRMEVRNNRMDTVQNGSRGSLDGGMLSIILWLGYLGLLLYSYTVKYAVMHAKV